MEARMEEFEMSLCIRRYLLYCNIWDAIIGDEVGCVRVLHNAMKGYRYAVQL